jgi:P4 family phage/plasmid primase-like protien
MPKITVLSGRAIRGWKGETNDEDTDQIQEWPTIEANVGLLKQFSTDAHFTCYYIEGETHIPRLNKEALSVLEGSGIDVRFDIAALDVDYHPHTEIPDDTWRDAEDAKVDQSDWGGKVALYHTRGGYRILCRLPRPYNVIEYTRFLSLWRKSASLQDITADPMIWNGLYRLPFVMRDGTAQNYRSYYLDGIDDLEPLSIEWLEESLGNMPSVLGSGDVTSIGSALDSIINSRQPFTLPKVIEEGTRNDTLYRYAGYLRAVGLGEEAIMSMLIEADLEKCQPPLQENRQGRAEVEAIAFRVVSQYDAGTPAPERIREAERQSKREPHERLSDAEFNAANPIDLEGGGDVDPGIYRAESSGGNGGGEAWTDAEAKPGLIAKLRRTEDDPLFDEESEKLYAEWVMREISDYQIDLMFCQQKLRKYDPETGLWNEVPSLEVQKLICTLDGARAYKGADKNGRPKFKRVNIGKRLIESIEGTLHTILKIPGAEMNPMPGMSFNNGFVQVDKEKGVTLLPFAREQRAISKIDYDFDFEPKTPKMDKFMDEVFVGSDAEAKKQFMWEFMGCSLAGLCPTMQKAVIGIGEGANGKSVFVDIWKGLMPEGRTTSIPPQKMGQEYAMAYMSNSLLNVVNETPSSEIAHSEAVKAVITGDKVPARFIRQGVFEFVPIAAQAFFCNDLPAFKDLSGGFARRWIIVAFTRIFEEQEQVKGLAKIILSAEKGAIICKALKHAAVVLKRGNYAEPTSSRTVKAAWRADNDHVMLFVEERCGVVTENVKNNGTTPKRLFQTYRIWCTVNGYDTDTRIGFSKRLKRLKHKQVKSDGKRYWALALKDEDE